MQRTMTRKPRSRSSQQAEFGRQNHLSLMGELQQLKRRPTDAPLASDETPGSFLATLQDIKPRAGEPLLEHGIYDDEHRRVICLTLENHTRMGLKRFGRGLLHYGHDQCFPHIKSRRSEEQPAYIFQLAIKNSRIFLVHIGLAL